MYCSYGGKIRLFTSRKLHSSSSNTTRKEFIGRHQAKNKFPADVKERRSHEK
jgi:hypothetical protein